MSTTTTYKSWVLNEYVKGELNKNNFRLVEQPLPKDIPTNHVLIRTLYVGFEPAMRPSISLGKSYREPHPLNTPMWAFGIGVVAESKSSRYKRGQKVVGMLDWSEYTVLPEKEVWPYDADVGLQHLSALSAPGVAAHVGLVAVANVKKGDVVLVSAAAGATGSVAIQVAKAVGASRVIGIASKSKCQSVLDNGADACVDYTSPNFESDLRKATNRKVNVYFDNVGGKILDAALPCMAMFGRVALCGMIAEYNKIGADAAEKFGIKNLIVAVSQSLTLRGYVVVKGLTPDDDLRRANRELTQWIKEGKIKARWVNLSPSPPQSLGPMPYSHLGHLQHLRLSPARYRALS